MFRIRVHSWYCLPATRLPLPPLIKVSSFPPKQPPLHWEVVPTSHLSVCLFKLFHKALWVNGDKIEAL